MKSIFVAIWYKGAFVPAGIIGFDKATNIAGFKYLSNYNGPPIDPVNLNYQKDGKRMFQVNRSTNNEMLHRVFQDALPGAWGMNVLMSENPELKQMKAAERLHWFGNRSVGGLSCRVITSDIKEDPISGIDRLAKVRKDSIALFNKTIGKLIDQNAWWGLCSHGGARPKTSYVDSKGDWIVKFNIDLDGFNGARVENTIARMAKDCGINSVETRSVVLPDDAEVLFIKRYDKDKNEDGTEFKAHQLSIYAMLDESRVRGPNEADYKDIADVVRNVSVEPETDLRLLFRQMLYHIAIHNADDHVRNFAMVLTDEGYRLSPAFDMTPAINDYPHSTSVLGDGRPTLLEKDVIKYAESFGINKDEAVMIRQNIIDVTKHWRDYMTANGVSAQDISVLERAFSNGIDNHNIIKESTQSKVKASV